MGNGEILYDVGGTEMTDADLPWNQPGILPEYGKDAMLFKRGSVISRGVMTPVMGMPSPNWMASYIKDPALKAKESARGRDEWKAYWKHVESMQKDPKLGAAARQLLEVKKNRAKIMIGLMKEKYKIEAPTEWFGPKKKDAFPDYIVGQNVPLEDNAFAAYKSRFG